MSPLRSLVIMLASTIVGGALAVAQEPKPTKDKPDFPVRPLEDPRDLTLLRRVSEDTFVHGPARLAFTIPKGWKEIPPHRLRRDIDTRISTVLGVERSDREFVASLYWIPMSPDQQLSHWVRETADAGEFGEEYETLKTVYGKDRVTPPVRFKSGPFDVYKIGITSGSDRADKYDGVLYVFAVESGGTTWLIKARISYPKGDQAKNDAWCQEVLSGFDKLPAAAKKPAPETPDTDKR